MGTVNVFDVAWLRARASGPNSEITHDSMRTYCHHSSLDGIQL